jgi:uncharacterized protein YndB with AHSA1/START domain
MNRNSTFPPFGEWSKVLTRRHMIANPTADCARIVLQRVFKAPCALVYRAWTEPQHMFQWWHCQDSQCRGIEADVRVGGAYRIHMVSDKGDHIAIGKYLEVVPNQRLRFSWQWENYPMPDSIVTIELEDLGTTTRLTLTHEGIPDRPETPDHKSGWTAALDRFGRKIETHEIKF